MSEMLPVRRTWLLALRIRHTSGIQTQQSRRPGSLQDHRFPRPAPAHHGVLTPKDEILHGAVEVFADLASASSGASDVWPGLRTRRTVLCRRVPRLLCECLAAGGALPIKNRPNRPTDRKRRPKTRHLSVPGSGPAAQFGPTTRPRFTKKHRGGTIGTFLYWGMPGRSRKNRGKIRHRQPHPSRHADDPGPSQLRPQLR